MDERPIEISVSPVMFCYIDKETQTKNITFADAKVLLKAIALGKCFRFDGSQIKFIYGLLSNNFVNYGTEDGQVAFKVAFLFDVHKQTYYAIFVSDKATPYQLIIE